MLRSLTEGQPDAPVVVDVAVVGAGLAGLVLASSLVREGLTVAVLESGAEKQDEGVHPLNSVEMVSQEYLGATEGRFRGLGGTSTRWGGALLPFLPCDMEAHPCGWHSGWGVSVDDLAPFLLEIENDFRVAAGPYEGPADLRYLASFEPRLPKWPVFRNRSTANIYREMIESSDQVTIWTEATVTELRLGESRVSGVVAQGPGRARIDISAKHVAITAGAIETTRLLLLFDRFYNGRIFPKDGPLGKCFHDHLSAPVAQLETVDPAALTRLFGFRFVEGGMRNLRFELGPNIRVERDLPAAFLHVAFSRKDKSGFDGLRRIYQATQKGVLPEMQDLVDVARDLPWFLRAGWWRLKEKRVLPPSGSHFELHLVTEQQPSADNSIKLSDNLTDSFGLPLARIDWRVAETDFLHFHDITSLSVSEWEAGALANLARPTARDRAEIEQDLSDCGGIYHPAGTTRIGANAKEGVVDSELRVHGVPGLWAVATSVFPAVGGTSPSLGLMQFAARAAAQISAEV